MNAPLALRFWTVFAVIASAACVGGSDEGECPTTEPRGAINITVYQSAAWSGTDVVMTFQRSPDARDSIRCTRRVVGPCLVSRCSNVGIDFVNGGPTCSGANPGALVVTREGAPSLSVSGGARITLERPFVSGERLAFRTGGGDVPAFASSITVPQRTRVLTPAGIVSGSGLQLRRGEALTVTWAPTTSLVMVTTGSTGDGDHSAQCVFDGATGSGVVPAEAVLGSSGNVEVSTLEESRLMAGAYPVTVRVRWPTDARALFSREE